MKRLSKSFKNLKKTHSQDYIRIGTGEQIDSLSLDDITLYSKKLIPFFNDYPNWILEFKTKSNNIKNFKDTHSIGNTVVSWSVNPEFIVQKEEHGTASLKERLNSALELKSQRL